MILFLIVILVTMCIVAQQRTVYRGRMANILATYLGSQRTPLDALRGLRDSTDAPATARALETACQDVESGCPVWAALVSCRLPLPRSFLRGMRAMEECGQLQQWLGAEAGRLKLRAEIQGGMLLALIYPAVCTALLFEIAWFVAQFILPTFVSLFEGMNLRLPWITKCLIQLKHTLASGFSFSQEPIFSTAALLVLGGWLWSRWRIDSPSQQNDRLSLFVDMLLSRLPVLGRLYTLAACEETASTLATLLGGGQPLPSAVRATSAAVNSSTWRRILREAATSTDYGTSLATALANERRVPRTFLWMCAMGERSEDLPETLRQAAGWYGAQLEQATRAAVTLFRVALVWLLGLLVAFYAFGVFVPFYQLIGCMS